MVGWRTLELPALTLSEIQTGTLDEFHEYLKDNEYHIDMVVAHNLKFDWKHITKDKGWLVHEPWHEVDMYCTMTAEYLNTGQAEKFVKLEGLATKYCIRTKKTLDLGAYIDLGGKMEEIPEEELREYLITDVDILTKVFIRQTKQYGHKFCMKYLHPLVEMELSGLPVDRTACADHATNAALVCDEFTHKCKEFLMLNCEWRDGDPIRPADFEKKIKPTANRTLSFMLAGEPAALRTTSDKWTVHYKRDSIGPLMSPLSIATVFKGVKPTNLGYPMDEATIERVNKHSTTFLTGSLPREIPTWRKQDKLLNTYYLPFLSKSESTGCLHPKLNTTATATGRLSSSDPNGQNFSEEARRLIVAPPGYTVAELDFSQLELVALAYLCGDKQMIKDINAGVDIHYETAAEVWGDSQAEEKRKIAKAINFGAVYGGKAQGLSYQTGVAKDKVQKVIDHLYTMYPGIAKWQKEFYKKVVDNMETNGHDDKGEQLYKSVVEEGGRTYAFFETESPRWLRKRMGRGYSFNPNQVYNYPIQGFAGWSIVLQYLYYLWAYCPEVKFIMTVHDSIVVLIPNDMPPVEFVNNVKQVADDFVAHLDLPVPLEVDVDFGLTWS